MIDKTTAVELQKNNNRKHCEEICYKAFKKIIEYEILKVVAMENIKCVTIDKPSLLLTHADLYNIIFKYKKFMGNIRVELEEKGFKVTRVTYDRGLDLDPVYHILWD